MRTGGRIAGRQTLGMVCVLLVFAAYFLFRGPARALRGHGGADFAAPYVATVRFLAGRNPYTSADFMADWRRAGAPASAVQNPSGQRPVYPPSTLILVTPLTLLRWRAALWTYELLSVALYGGLLWALACEVGAGTLERARAQWAQVWFVAYGLALAPVQTALGTGNLSMLTFLLSMLSLLTARARREGTAGLLLAASLCLKPSVGWALLVYFLFARRWKACGVGVAASVTLTGAALWRIRGVPGGWLPAYRSNVAYLFGPEGVANFTGSHRFDLLNLQVPLFDLSGSPEIADVLSLTIFSILFVTWGWLVWRRPRLLEGWAAPGALLLLSLLPVYQRNYNAGFVLVAILWSFQHLRSRVAHAILTLGSLFVVPGEALLRNAAGHFPAALNGSKLWRGFVLPQANWGLLAMVLLLLFTMWVGGADRGETLWHERAEDISLPAGGR